MDYKIGILIPTRGDRGMLLDFAKEQLSRQTRQPDLICVVDDPPLSEKKDITYRYRIGCQRLFAKGMDVVIFIEDDDWYHHDYIQFMTDAWDNAGRPDIFGLASTIYYHLGIRAWQESRHPGRASAMSTIVSKNVTGITWPKDEDPWTDIHLWKALKGQAIFTPKVLSIGIKGHQVGDLFGGIGHNKAMSGYKQQDPNMAWLFGNIDTYAIQFYTKLLPRLS